MPAGEDRQAVRTGRESEGLGRGFEREFQPIREERCDDGLVLRAAERAGRIDEPSAWTHPFAETSEELALQPGGARHVLGRCVPLEVG